MPTITHSDLPLPLLFFVSFSLSTSFGLFVLCVGHTLLSSFGVPGFTTLPPHTSHEIGLVGGAFTALPALAMRNVLFDLSQFLGFFHAVVVLPAVAAVAIGAVQGYVGAKICEGKTYSAIDGQKLPSILGVGSASLAGAVGALCLVTAIIVLMVSFLLLAFFLEDPHEGTRPFSPVAPDILEAEQD